MKMKSLLFMAIPMALIAGCAVGPNYRRPAISAPARWTEPLRGGETNAAASLAAWWKNFHDSELNSLVDRAVRSNLDLRVADARVREARAQYGVAVGSLLPTIDASASYARTETSHRQPVLGSIPIPAGVPFDNNLYQAGFDASWEIDVFGGKRRAMESARARVQASEYGRRAAWVTLLGEVARNYIDLRGRQRALAIANENIQAQNRALAITQDRFSKGLTSDLDVQQAATLLATTKAEVPSLQTEIQISIHRLGVLLGQQPGALAAELTNAAPIPAAPPQVPVGLPSELLLRRPDVQLAERRLAAATANIGAAKSDLFPKFYLTGVTGFESISAGDWFAAGSRFWSAGPTVQWRIFDAGRIRANIRVKNARQEEALANYEQTTLTAFEDVENSLAAYANEQIRRQSLQDAVASSRKSLDLANKLYANGLADFLQVLDAERSLYQTQDALVQSDQAVSTDVISLYKSLGGGWETPSPASTSVAASNPTYSNRERF
ncbi:MAG: efflux transporter outer membrane subunit [Verrucomicrobia bacterium]|nr:efflux transporter outer membrane subunit [Verrucomicrobiota bacterium]MDE3099853.1 efflux transporter outer membrane subunit [Verrucomicrobiota bacterium]